MKIIRTQKLITALLVYAFGGHALAQEIGKVTPLPNTLPPSVVERVGPVEFKDGLPTPKGAEQLLNIQDFQRATQLYQWAIPVVAVMGWEKASIANGSEPGSTDWIRYDNYKALTGVLTPTSVVTYMMSFPDLEKTGPLVLEYAPGQILGIVMDYWQRPLFDYGLAGPEKGAAGGKVLIIGPGQKEPEDTPGYYVVHMHTRFAFIGYRITDRSQQDKLIPQFKLYPYSERNNPPANKVIATTKDYLQTPPRGLDYWERLNEVIQREPAEQRDVFYYAMLRNLGMEPGKPFKPDDRQKKILEDGALLGEEISRVIVHDKPGFGKRYRPDAQWDLAIPFDPNKVGPNYAQLDERIDWLYEAIAISPAMVPKTPGFGSAYLSVYRDKDGGWLDGGKSYSLHVPPNPPADLFWSLSVYDMDTRTYLRNNSPKSAELSSRDKGLQQNADGSVDLYFGPDAPKDKESNWVKTVPGKTWFPYFRLYGPTQAYFDRSWPLPDIEKVK